MGLVARVRVWLLLIAPFLAAVQCVWLRSRGIGRKSRFFRCAKSPAPVPTVSLPVSWGELQGWPVESLAGAPDLRRFGRILKVVMETRGVFNSVIVNKASSGLLSSSSSGGGVFLFAKQAVLCKIFAARVENIGAKEKRGLRRPEFYRF